MLSLHRKAWPIAICMVIGLIALDFGTKYWAQKSLLSDRFAERSGDYPTCTGPRDEMRRAYFIRNNANPRVLIPHFFQLRYVENCGSSFNLMSNVSEQLRLPFMVFLALVACVGIPWLYLRTPWTSKYMLWALPLILAGAVGNLIDRVRYRYVVDFIDGFVVLRNREYHWPTFNLADTFILLGLALMVYQYWNQDPESTVTTDGSATDNATIAKHTVASHNSSLGDTSAANEETLHD